MKHLVSYMLCLCVLFSLLSSVWAAESEEGTVEDELTVADTGSASPDNKVETSASSADVSFSDEVVTEDGGVDDESTDNVVDLDSLSVSSPISELAVGFPVSPDPTSSEVFNDSETSSLLLEEMDGLDSEPDTSAVDEIADLIQSMVADGSDLSLLEAVAGMVLGVVADPVHFSIQDLRETSGSDTDSSEVSNNMKDLVISIFGEYHPVLTTSVITQTVGNDTYQILVDTVADGIASIDYAWCAGVLLFAILLFCAMRLLGGILS